MANFNDSVANGVLSAVDLLTKKALSDLKFDKTYSPCTIISRSEEDKNIYTCEYENTRFEAYSEQSFFAGEQVQVLVPQNNWDNQKRIVSRLMTGSSAAYNFKWPFDDFVQVAALEVEDLYSLLTGCVPVYVADLAALGNAEEDIELKKQHRYEQNQDKEYVWGITPYECTRIIETMREEKIAIIQQRMNNFIAFDNVNTIYDCIHHEYAALTNAVNNLSQNHAPYYTLSELQILVAQVGRAIEADPAYTESTREQCIAWLQEDNARLSAYYQQEYAKFSDTTNIDDDADYNYLENGTLHTIKNAAHQYASINNFITNLTSKWESLNTKVFDWKKLTRDLAYPDMLAMVTTEGVSDEVRDNIIQAWLQFKAKYAKTRTLEQIYNEYRITPICGGPEVSYKFWANRKFYDVLTGHYSKLFTKLCSFVPANGAATIEGFTKAGLQIDVESFLNQYPGLKGTYGVKIVVEGVKKTTDEESSTSTYTADEYNKRKAALEAQYAADVAVITEQYANDEYNKQLALTRLDIRYDDLWRKLDAHLIDTGSNEYGIINEENNIIFDDEFTNAEFIGNSYAYTIPYSQQKLLNIEDYISISKITLFVFQNFDSYDLANNLIHGWSAEGNMTVEYKYALPGVDETILYVRSNESYDDLIEGCEAAVPETLALHNPYLGLGFAVQELAEGKLILYTEEPLEYGLGGAELRDQVETRNLKAIWVKADANNGIYIYPSWEMNAETQTLIELQPTERALFYSRDDEKDLNALIESYRELYNTPFDATRANKQKIIIDVVNRWLIYERRAIQLERERITARQNELTEEQDNITVAVDALNAKLASLENQLATIDSIADLSVLNNITLYTQREIDEARSKLSDKLQQLIMIDQTNNPLLLKYNLDILSTAVVNELMQFEDEIIFTEDMFVTDDVFCNKVANPYLMRSYETSSNMVINPNSTAHLHFLRLYALCPGKSIIQDAEHASVASGYMITGTGDSLVNTLIRQILYCYYQIALQEKKLQQQSTTTVTTTDPDGNETTTTTVKKPTSRDFYQYGKMQEQLAAELVRQKAAEYMQKPIKEERHFTFSAWQPAKIKLSWDISRLG